MPEKRRFLFLVQGEGRGHLTQALRLHSILHQLGHQVVAVAVGRSKRRQLPDYFSDQLPCPIHRLESPNFITDRRHKAVRPWPSIWRNLLKSPVYLRSLSELDDLVTQYEPDVLVNFYDFLGGMYMQRYKPALDYVVVAHQYLAGHPSFRFAPGAAVNRQLYLWANAFTRTGASQVWALSFLPYPPLKKGRLRIMPPLMRQEIFAMRPVKEDFILAYMVNPGYGQELVAWSQQHPGVKVEAFWDNPDHPEPYQATPDLTLHPLDGKKFMAKMERCKAYASTAGFESICEVAYLGKPILMVPTKGQYEQRCNALEAQREGIGLAADHFDLNLLALNLATWEQPTGLKAWMDSAQEQVAQALSQLPSFAEQQPLKELQERA